MQQITFKRKHWSPFLYLVLGSLSLLLVLQFTKADLSGESKLDNDISSNLDDDSITSQQTPSPSSNKKDEKLYVSPQLNSDDLHLYEHFDDEEQFTKNWISSSDPKYAGNWKLEPSIDRSSNDKQLLLPLKARYYGISSKLQKPFKFNGEHKKPLIVQYEVEFRDGLDCGGAYAKLIRESALDDLSKLTDKTPFSIMFGPDKCGSDTKLHFIIQYPNPKTNGYEEKHWKKSKFVAPLTLFSDRTSHLFKLILEPDNKFEIFIDDKSVGQGNLLQDLDPEINPPKEIEDPKDVKPENWDERPQIEDPAAEKPVDWDEDQPMTIDDPSSTKPEDWLENEPTQIHDPDAKKPDDWEDMDGEWEAPLIDNPACAKVSGCGEWKPAKIANPAFKGKWKVPKIDNPNYKGKWTPKMIPNPDYFFDESPFSSLDSIGAISFELWSMADNIAFDNILITGNKDEAEQIMKLTWEEKRPIVESKTTLESLTGLAKEYPYLGILVVLALLVSLYFTLSFFRKSKPQSDDGDSIVKKKKLDQSRPDDRSEEQPNVEEVTQDEDAEETEDIDDEEEQDEEVGEDEDQTQESGKKKFRSQ